METGRRVHAEFRLGAIKGGPCGILRPSWDSCCSAQPWLPSPRLRNPTALGKVCNRVKSAHWIRSLTVSVANARAALPMSKDQISAPPANRIIAANGSRLMGVCCGSIPTRAPAVFWAWRAMIAGQAPVLLEGPLRREEISARRLRAMSRPAPITDRHVVTAALPARQTKDSVARPVAPMAARPKALIAALANFNVDRPMGPRILRAVLLVAVVDSREDHS